MKTFSIFGYIVDDATQTESLDDVKPYQIKTWLEGLDDNEEVEILFNSFGGSVSAGLAISNLIKQAKERGIKTTAHVLGVACSSASFIALACDKLVMDSNAFLMIHNPYTWIEGNAKELRKEADVLDKMKESIIDVYSTKFRLSKEEISQWMNSETWIKGSDAPEVLNVEVIPTDNEVIIMDSKKNKYFNKLHIPEEIKIMKDEVKEDKVEKTVTEKTTVETIVEEKTIEEDKPVEEVVKDKVEMIPLNECEKRVSGMQSTMAKKIEAIKAEFTAKIEEFENQIKVKNEELTEKENVVINLTSKLEITENELQKTVSALQEKETAIETLNSTANTRKDEPIIDWRNLKGQAFFDYVKNHPELTKNN